MSSSSAVKKLLTQREKPSKLETKHRLLIYPKTVDRMLFKIAEDYGISVNSLIEAILKDFVGTGDLQQ